MNSNEKAKVMKILEQIETCLMITLSEEGRVHSRPMAILTNPESDRPLVYFYIKKTSTLGQELKNREDVHLGFMDQDSQVYISCQGRGKICEDKDLKEKLWSPTFKAWIPDGLEDKDLGLMEVEINQANIWDTPGGRLISFENDLNAQDQNGAFKEDSSSRPISL